MNNKEYIDLETLELKHFFKEKGLTKEEVDMNVGIRIINGDDCRCLTITVKKTGYMYIAKIQADVDEK